MPRETEVKESIHKRGYLVRTIGEEGPPESDYPLLRDYVTVDGLI